MNKDEKQLVTVSLAVNKKKIQNFLALWAVKRDCPDTISNPVFISPT